MPTDYTLRSEIGLPTFIEIYDGGGGGGANKWATFL